MEEINGRPTFQVSIDTKLVVDRFKQAAVGEVVSFKALSEALGRKVEGDCPNVQSALRILLNDHTVFENVRSIGYKRLNDVEIVGTAERDREALRRRAKKTVKRLSSVREFDKLPNDMKIKHNAAMSGFGAIAAMLTTGRMKRLEEKVEVAQQQLPLAKTLECFKS